MPGAFVLRHQADNLALFADQVMRAHFRSGIAHALDRAFDRLHLGIMEHDHIDRCLALVPVGRSNLTMDERIGHGVLINR